MPITIQGKKKPSGAENTLSDVFIHSRGLSTFPHELLSLVYIKRLDLSFNELTTLSPDLVGLVNMRHLILTGNKFTAVPDVLCEMDKLHTLIMSKNSIRELPPGLGRMAELRELDLFMNKVSQAVFLEPIKDLHTLLLRANKLTELSTSLVCLKSLTHLDVSNNKIASLTPLAQMPRLTKLECAGCNVQSIALFSQANMPICNSLSVLVVSRNRELTTLCDMQCPQLTELRAAGCNIDRVATTLKNCPKLRIMDLDGNPIRDKVQFETPKLDNLGMCNTKTRDFPEMPTGALVELALANAQITHLPAKADASLQSLRRLYLQDNDIAEIAWSFLQDLTQLQELSLRFNKLTRVPEAMVIRPTVVVLDLAGNQLRELPGNLFEHSSSLNQLNLSDNKLQDLPDSLWRCSNLVFLNVFSNNLRNLSPEIGNLVNMRELYAGDNVLTHLPEEISKLSHLKVLHVAGNSISHLAPSLELVFLEKLYAGRNQMKEFPNSISRCPNLDTLDLSGNCITVATVDNVFPNLQELILSHNQLHVFHTTLGAGQTFPKLVCLDLSDNEINAVPQIAGISTLEIVNLLHCNISHLTRKQLEDYSTISLIYMQGNPIEKNRQLRVSFVERKTDLLMADLHKTPHSVALGYRLRNSSTDADRGNGGSDDFPNSGRSSGNSVLYSWSEVKGARTTQEDAISVRSELQGEEQLQLFAVFDGHRGSDVSKMCAVHFPSLLRTHLSNLSHNTITAIGATFAGLSKMIAAEKMSDGATAAVALIQQDTIAMAHLGDARVVLFSQSIPSRTSGRKPPSDEDESNTSSSAMSQHPANFRHITRKVVKLSSGGSVLVTATMDHTAKNRVERRRVEQELGGFVSEAGHVMGDCAVTRALGDLQFSPFVTNEPSIVLMPKTGSEMFMVVACDGFWDTCTNEKALHIVMEHLSTRGDPSTCSLHLRDYALSMGSTDNISVLCLLFPSFTAMLAQRPDVI